MAVCVCGRDRRERERRREGELVLVLSTIMTIIFLQALFIKFILSS